MADKESSDRGASVLGFIQSAEQAISTELRPRHLTPYDRHLMRQPFLQDFIPRYGSVDDAHIENFRHALEDWLDGERILRAQWRSGSSEPQPDPT